MVYTTALKHIVLVDVFIIASGFVLRALAGAVVISVNITAWWLLSVFFLALFLGLGKRRSEVRVLTSGAGTHRPTLEEYSSIFLDYMLLIVIACTITVYSQATFTSPLASHYALSIPDGHNSAGRLCALPLSLPDRTKGTGG